MNRSLNSDFTVINHKPLGKSCNLSKFQGVSPIKRITVALSPKCYYEDEVSYEEGQTPSRFLGTCRRPFSLALTLTNGISRNIHINSLPAGKRNLDAESLWKNWASSCPVCPMGHRLVPEHLGAPVFLRVNWELEIHLVPTTVGNMLNKIMFMKLTFKIQRTLKIVWFLIYIKTKGREI